MSLLIISQFFTSDDPVAYALLLWRPRYWGAASA